MEYLEALDRWQELSDAIKHMTQEERALREALFSGTFPDPKEGTNKHTLPDGRVVKGTYSLNRKVLEDELPDALEALPEDVREKIIKRKPELVKSVYNKLDAEQRQAFDAALDIKPGLPKLEVVAK
jgi:hypothetical protein